MTKQEAIKSHRKLWNWIADETERQERKVRKIEYFNYQQTEKKDLPQTLCYCCEYDKGHEGVCFKCPIDWGTRRGKINDCMCTKSLYGEWLDSKNWQEAARLARKIAELPEYKEAL